MIVADMPVDSDREIQPVLMRECAQSGLGVRLVVLEDGMQTGNRDLVFSEHRTDMPQLRDRSRHAAWAQQLEGQRDHHATAQRFERNCLVRAEPLLDVPRRRQSKRRQKSPSRTYG